MKRGYVNFQSLILTISIVSGLSYDKANGLPQDWPCFDFELNKINKDDKSDEFSKLLKLNYANYLKKSPDAKKYKGWFSRIERL